LGNFLQLFLFFFPDTVIICYIKTQAKNIDSVSERRDFEIDDGTHWPMLDGVIPTDQFVINPVRPGQSYGMFMNRFNQLMERR
jgi:hypothetical protein